MGVLVAVSPWAQLEQQNLQPPPDMPPPVFAPSSMSSPMPDLSSAPIAKVRPPTAGEDQISNDQQALQKVRWNQANPWGTAENHPGALGKVGHAFATLGNIAGEVFAPGVAANIPGSQLNMQEKEGALAKRLNSEITDESQNQERGAQQAHLQEETDEAPEKATDAHNLSAAQAGNLDSETDTRRHPDPTLLQGYAHATNAALAAGRDPATDPLVQHYADALTAIQPGMNKEAAAPKTIAVVPPGGKNPHEMAWDTKTGKYDLDQGEHYEKPTTVNVNAGLAGLDRESSRFAKPYEKGVSDANSQLEKIADARTMINGSAEAQALGVPKVLTALVSGQGSGVRITQPELNAIGNARGISGDVEGTLNSWAGKGKLTPTQQKQLTGLLDAVKQRIIEKSSIHAQALDAINGAGTREDIVKADKEARQKLSQLEQGGGGAPQGADNEVYVGGKLVGHTVGGKYVALGK